MGLHLFIKVSRYNLCDRGEKYFYPTLSPLVWLNRNLLVLTDEAQNPAPSICCNSKRKSFLVTGCAMYKNIYI